MSKKRNLAVLMAAATVATSVAPVFADTTASLDGQEISAKDSAKLSQLKSEIEGYLNTKYTTDKDLLKNDDLAGDSVYAVKAQVNGATEEKDDGTGTMVDVPVYSNIASMKDLDKLIVAMKNDNDTIKVVVEDKGHKEVDGKILDNEVKSYKLQEIKDLKAVTTTGNTLADLDGVTNVDFGNNTIVLTLQNNDDKFIIKQGDEKTVHIDGANVVGETIYKEDAYGNKLDKDGAKAKTPADYVALGFEKYKESIDDTDDDRTFDITNKDVVDSVKASEIYNVDLDKFTQEGNEIAKFVAEYNAAAGAKITLDDSDPNKLVLKATEIKDDIVNKFTTLTINGTTKEIAGIKAALTTTPSIVTLAGENREATSIEVSKATFADKNAGSGDKAKDVVLVSGYAIADGLAATPFAKAKTAPVLLTGKDKISDAVMDEIERVKANDGKVYLVGGTNSLSKGIEDQLDAKYIKFERVAGADRADTSLKIAKKMVDDKDSSLSELFVAGGYAEADAMSIAAVAASGVQKDKLTTGVDPILLADKNGLTADQLAWLGRQDTIKTTYIAGGENSVPKTVSSSLNDISAKTYRLAGDNRQGTNAKILSEFFDGNTAFDKVYVAKSDNNGLVDALPAGVLAGRGADPIVLATDSLSADQDSALNSLDTKVGTITKGNKVQIGNGIADKVWEAINDID